VTVVTKPRSRVRPAAALAIAGWLSLVGGLALIFPPLALVVGGLVLVLLSIGLNVEGRRR
jgi:hypothetical protein